MHFFFRNSFSWHLDNLQNNIFAPLQTICVFFWSPKNTKTSGKQANKCWTDLWLNLGQIFDSKQAKSWTDFWLYIYMFMDLFTHMHREREERHHMHNFRGSRSSSKGNDLAEKSVQHCASCQCFAKGVTLAFRARGFFLQPKILDGLLLRSFTKCLRSFCLLWKQAHWIIHHEQTLQLLHPSSCKGFRGAIA